MPQQSWAIDSDQTRTLKFPIAVPDFPNKAGVLEIAVGHPSDDSGDKAMRFSLLNTDGEIIRKGSMRTKNTHLIRHKVKPNSHLTLLLTDKDISFTGPEPGNKGTLQIQLEYALAPCHR